MISTLYGEVIEATPICAIIDVGGIGYEVRIPVTTAERLPGPGGKAKLFTHVVYREDEQAMYGFINREERDFFRMLIEKVSGVGPRIALAILSKMSLPMLSSAIAAGDVALLSRTPGVGRKTAERLIVELRDKMAAFSTISGSGVPASGAVVGTAVAGAGAFCDAVNALVALGYKPETSDKAVQKARLKLGEAASVEALVRAALTNV
jgi:Holliday junction DNA helicase RuvA